MSQGHKGAVQAIRHFNRYYTNKLGLLSRYHFVTRFTLTEARVMLEIGRRGKHAQTGLCADLAIDMGYLNRVIKRLAALGLVATRRDPQDGRVLVLELTGAGREALEEINTASDSRTDELLAPLSDAEAQSLVEHLNAAERILERRSANPPHIDTASSAFDIATARVLMEEYAAFLGEDLSFQGFQKELATLPGKYAPPSGALLLARVPTGTGGTEPAGCVALRRLSAGICEMKRMFVRPEYRGLGIGRALAERIIEEARSLGYRAMRLDTLERLEGAVSLYRGMGFVRIPPYCRNPLPGVMFWEKALSLGRLPHLPVHGAPPTSMSRSGEQSSRKRPAP